MSFPARQYAPPVATVRHLVERQACCGPDRLALAAPRSTPISYCQLNSFLQQKAAELHALGVCQTTRVALAVPPGPDAVAASLAVMYCAVCVPLNPGYQDAELETRLRRLKAGCLVVSPGDTSAAVLAARTCGIPIIRISSEPGGAAGEFRIQDAARLAAAREPESPRPEDLAVVMQTSGTTGQPKTVPLTHANLCASARHIRDAMLLGPEDRFLSVAPAHHIVGVGLTLASLSAGSCMFCAPGFYRARFFEWMEEFPPTWFWVTPEMLRQLLPLARRHGEVLARCPLRFLRSGSSSLPPEVLAEAEAVFQVPVTENYGMTEASPQITCNPISPGKRKPGSAGLPAGPEVMVRGAQGGRAAPGETGEILVRGPNVMQGYEDDPEANREAFRNGWFRTGDLGWLDRDGYLFLTGRVREMINRAGEKISPRAVEQVLLSHPEVADAAVFAMAQERLGEDVAAAVVLQAGAQITAEELREFAAARLAAFEVPARILSVSQIPKGLGGKVQRAGLAARLGLCAPVRDDSGGPPPFVAPSTPVEKALAEIWSNILKVERTGIHDNFFELGGDSFAFNLLLMEVQDRFAGGNHLLNWMDFYDSPTIGTLSRILAEVQARESLQGRLPVVALQRRGRRLPFYLVPWVGGGPLYYLPLSRCLGNDQPFYVLQDLTLPDEPGAQSIEELAGRLIRGMRTLQPRGPYMVGGHCFGGVVAFEIAQQLCAEGEEGVLLALLDTPTPGYPSLTRHWRLYVEGFRVYVASLGKSSVRSAVSRVWLGAAACWRHLSRLLFGWLDRAFARAGQEPVMGPARDIAEANRRASRMYVPRPYPGRVVNITTEDHPQTGSPLDRRLGWREVAGGGFEVYLVRGDHLAMLSEPNVREPATQLRTLIERFHKA